MSIRLLIVDDHELVREGLRMTFEGTDVQIVAEATDGQEAFEKVQLQPLDVALVDIRMPRSDGFQFLEMLRAAELTLPVVLMHSVQDGALAVRRSQELGAKGILQKGLDQDQLLAAIARVHGGQDLWSDPAKSPPSP